MTKSELLRVSLLGCLFEKGSELSICQKIKENEELRVNLPFRAKSEQICFIFHAVVCSNLLDKMELINTLLEKCQTVFKDQLQRYQFISNHISLDSVCNKLHRY